MSELAREIRNLVRPGETISNTYELLNGLADRIEAEERNMATRVREELRRADKFVTKAMIRTELMGEESHAEAVRYFTVEAALALLDANAALPPERLEPPPPAGVGKAGEILKGEA